MRLKCSVTRNARTEPEAIAVAKAIDEQKTRKFTSDEKKASERQNEIAEARKRTLEEAEHRIELAKTAAASQPDVLTSTIVRAVHDKLGAVVGDMLGAIGQASAAQKLPPANGQ